MVKRIAETVAAIMVAGGVLYAARQVPGIDKLAEIVTKGYGE